jgi:hypothetical protein
MLLVLLVQSYATKPMTSLSCLARQSMATMACPTCNHNLGLPHLAVGVTVTLSMGSPSKAAISSGDSSGVSSSGVCSILLRSKYLQPDTSTKK